MLVKRCLHILYLYHLSEQSGALNLAHKTICVCCDDQSNISLNDIFPSGLVMVMPSAVQGGKWVNKKGIDRGLMPPRAACFS